MPLVRTDEGEYEVAGRDKLKRLCPHCHKNYVLYVWVGGHMSCASPECKQKALDAQMDAEQRLH